MDLYALTPAFDKAVPIDIFDSLIWTDRYSDSGDIELKVSSNTLLRSVLVEGTFMSIPDSKEIMMLDTISEEEGEITCTGSSLDAIFAQRIFRDTWQTTNDSWTLTGTAANMARAVVFAMVLPNGLMTNGSVLANGAAEIIPNMQLGATPGDGVSTTFVIPYGNLYDAVKQICDADSLGFSLYPGFVNDDGSHQLVFDIIRGSDRTSTQSTYQPVIFQSALDNLTDLNSLRSLAGWVTQAYAFGAGMTTQSQMGSATASGTSGYTGFKRRTLMVDASDVNLSDYANAAAFTAALNQKALDGLANNNYVRMFNGQIVPQNGLEFNTDYFLGDVIELRDDTSNAQKARITEYIRSQDNTGERAYPTLSVIG